VLGLYLHIPFCAAICNYCNFNRGLFDAALKERYVTALLTEIRRAGDGAAADTIYFGGGTPSLLDPSEVAAIVKACRESWTLAPDAEVTLEANPETVTDRSLVQYREAGVNRISFGVQSFRDEELVRLDRLHTAARARDAFQAARRAGFDNISLDLMMWLPQQSVAEWLQSVDALIALGPEHASLYMLEVYPNAPLRDAMARSRWSLAPEDDVVDMYLSCFDRMDTAGYVQYEISNAARPGRESRHNLKYWSDGEWLGLGCGAHSTRRGVRWKNLPATVEYIERVAAGQAVVWDERGLSPVERIEEALFMGLRRTCGLDLAAFQRQYGTDVWSTYGTQLQRFVDAQLLIYDGRSVRMTRSGMLLAHEIMTVFIRAAVR
jgi:oxygen-independent coproporphyrinogen-3 oxidase